MRDVASKELLVLFKRFIAFHPYLSFSDPTNTIFVEPNGEKINNLKEDTAGLFSIGREIYKLLPEAKSVQEFDEGFIGYCETVEGFRKVLQAKEMIGKLKAWFLGGDKKVGWSSAESSSILDAIWQVYGTQTMTAPDLEIKEYFRQIYLFHALNEIDAAIVSLHKDDIAGFSRHSVGAHDAWKNALEIESGSKKLEEIKKGSRIEVATTGSDAQHNKPGGSREKGKAIREIWATGKYDSRDLCAEQECAALNMSFSSARKWLRNTPDNTG